MNWSEEETLVVNNKDEAKKSGKLVHWNEFRIARKRLQKNLKSAREAYISDFLGDAQSRKTRSVSGRTLSN